MLCGVPGNFENQAEVIGSVQIHTRSPSGRVSFSEPFPGLMLFQCVVLFLHVCNGKVQPRLNTVAWFFLSLYSIVIKTHVNLYDFE